MKKNYMRPESTVVKIEGSQLMNIASDPNVKVNTTESVDAASVDSRSYDDWDE